MERHRSPPPILWLKAFPYLGLLHAIGNGRDHGQGSKPQCTVPPRLRLHLNHRAAAQFSTVDAEIFFAARLVYRLAMRLKGQPESTITRLDEGECKRCEPGVLEVC